MRTASLEAFCNKALFQGLVMRAVLQGRFFVNDALFDQVEEALVHSAHAETASRSNSAINLVGLFLANQVTDSRRDEHDLEGGNHPASDGRHQLLRYDSLQRRSQLEANLALLGSRKDVDDAVDGP